MIPSSSPGRRLAPRPWTPTATEDLTDRVAEELTATSASSATSADWLTDLVQDLVSADARIHDEETVNLDPASNRMSARAAAVASGGIGTRPSLGYPGDKYEMGLEAVERIELVAAELAARVFDADFAEVRVPSGAIANLYAFMAMCRPGDPIIVPPASIGGHVTHRGAGAAGLYGLDIHEAPIDADNYTIDLDGLAALAERVRPRLITIGGSLNLTVHDVAGVRSVADAHDALVLFDAAHLSGLIAGGAWPNPLTSGAHLITMSTYKSLAGPAAGLVLTNDPALAERIEAIAFPGLTANFDAGQTAALAVTLGEWLADGATRAATMVDCANALAAGLVANGAPVHLAAGKPTVSHAFALDARRHGGGTALARHLRRANLLTSAIGLPTGDDDGLRVGPSELALLGFRPGDMGELGSLLARAMATESPEDLAPEVSAYRRRS